MNTATQPPPVTAQADRFRCASDVPDPPRDAAGRKQYWEDTVAEAVAELRRRLASTRDEKSFQALQMILDLEKTRLRHKAPVAGTEVGGGYSSPLPPMEPCVPGGREPKKEDLTPPAAPEKVADTQEVAPILPTSPRRGEVGNEATGRGAASRTDPIPADPQPDAPAPSPERGGGRGVGSSTPPPPSRHEEEVGPDGLTADQRAWIQEGHDYYDRLDAARAERVRLLW